MGDPHDSSSLKDVGRDQREKDRSLLKDGRREQREKHGTRGTRRWRPITQSEPDPHHETIDVTLRLPGEAVSKSESSVIVGSDNGVLSITPGKEISLRKGGAWKLIESLKAILGAGDWWVSIDGEVKDVGIILHEHTRHRYVSLTVGNHGKRPEESVRFHYPGRRMRWLNVEKHIEPHTHFIEPDTTVLFFRPRPKPFGWERPKKAKSTDVVELWQGVHRRTLVRGEMDY